MSATLPEALRVGGRKTPIDQAIEIEHLLSESGEEMPEPVRSRMEAIARNLRGAGTGEMHPPNIPVDEPIPGADPKTDEIRAESGTGTLPRADREYVGEGAMIRAVFKPPLDAPAHPQQTTPRRFGEPVKFEQMPTPPPPQAWGASAVDQHADDLHTLAQEEAHATSQAPPTEEPSLRVPDVQALEGER